MTDVEVDICSRSWDVLEVRCPECAERMPTDEATEHWDAFHREASA